MVTTLKQGIDFIAYTLSLAFIIMWILPIGQGYSLILAVLVAYAGYLQYKEKNGKSDNTKKPKSDNRKSDI